MGHEKENLLNNNFNINDSFCFAKIFSKQKSHS